LQAALENRTKESKQEMDILDALEEIKDLNARKMNVDLDDLIAARQEAKQKLLEQRRVDKEAAIEASDDAAVTAAFGTERVKRLESSSDEEEGAGSGGHEGGTDDASTIPGGGGSRGSGGGPVAAAAEGGGKPKANLKRGVNLGPAAGDEPREKKARSATEPRIGMLGGLASLKGLLKKRPIQQGGGGGAAASKPTPKAAAAAAAAAPPVVAATGGGGGGLLGSDYSDSD
jgi:hypothetical protein